MNRRSLYTTPYSRDEVLSVAAVSIFLYGFLFSSSFYFFVKLLLKPKTTSYSVATTFEMQMDDSRKLFFAIISFSALFDMPVYVGCIAYNGPSDCEWDGALYKSFWMLHLFAVGGYAMALGIPLYLWSEVVNGRDGKIWNSRFKPDFTRKYLYGATALYMAIQILIIISVGAFYNTEKKQYDEYIELKTVTSVAESICITLISAGWCWCGIRLQLRVRRVQFRPEAERKILFIVTMIMSAITLSFFTRAVFVLSLIHENEDGYRIPSFTLWVLGTRWLPYIMCSFMLIYIMRRSEGQRGNEVVSLLPTGSHLSKTSNDDDTNVIISAIYRDSSKSEYSDDSAISFVSETSAFLDNPEAIYEQLRSSSTPSPEPGRGPRVDTLRRSG